MSVVKLILIDITPQKIVSRYSPLITILPVSNSPL